MSELWRGILHHVRCAMYRLFACLTLAFSHRSQDSHSCSAPRPRDEYYISLAERQVFARETLANAFPAQAGRVIPKPPPARNIVRDPPVDVPGDTLPPMPPQPITAASRVPASKADKLRALTVRKMKSLAKPVDVKMANTPMEDRRYFTWEVDESGEQLGNWNALTAVEKEVMIGKRLVDGGKEKAEQLWAPSVRPHRRPFSDVQNMSAGRVLDLLAKQAKLRHIHDPTDATQASEDAIRSLTDTRQNLGLVALSNPPLAPATTPRSWQRLDLSKTLSSQIEDCVRLLVVRGA